jgi:hypothetical protein
MHHTCNEDPRTTKWMQKRRWVAVTCWDVEGTEDDISHVVAADDGVEARGSPHVVAVAWLQTFRRRQGCGVRLPLDRSGRATQIGDGCVVEESGRWGGVKSRMVARASSARIGDGGTTESGVMGWRRGGVRLRTVARTSSAWIGDGCAMEGDGLRDGVGWHRGREDSERFGGDGLESYPGSEFRPLELDQILGFNSVVGHTS